MNFFYAFPFEDHSVIDISFEENFIKGWYVNGKRRRVDFFWYCIWIQTLRILYAIVSKRTFSRFLSGKFYDGCYCWKLRFACKQTISYGKLTILKSNFFLKMFQFTRSWWSIHWKGIILTVNDVAKKITTLLLTLNIPL